MELTRAQVIERGDAMSSLLLQLEAYLKTCQKTDPKAAPVKDVLYELLRRLEKDLSDTFNKLFIIAVFGTTIITGTLTGVAASNSGLSSAGELAAVGAILGLPLGFTAGVLSIPIGGVMQDIHRRFRMYCLGW